MMFRFLALCIYFVGIVIAKGFWSTFFAILIPFYSWYLAFDWAITKYFL